MVKLGFMRTYGVSMRHILSKATSNRLIAFGSGMGVTALLQSSTAAILLLISFVKKHKVSLGGALAVVIGADLATTLIAQVLTFDLSWLSPALLIMGVLGHNIAFKTDKYVHLARVVIGLGLMLLALSLIRQAAAPLASSEILPMILAPLEYDPIMAILIAATITWIMHSSLAAVLLFASFATNGVIDIELGVLLIMGANLGGAIIPLSVTYNEGVYARRITFGNLAMRVTTLFGCFIFMDEILGLLHLYSTDASRQFVNFHTGFNLVLAIVFLPLTHIMARILEKIFPVPTAKSRKEYHAVYLDDKALDTPVIALASSARETLRMAEIVQGMLEKSIDAFKQNDERLANEIARKDDTVDRLYATIKSYLTQLTRKALDPSESRRYMHIITFATNLEHVGDIIDKSLVELAKKKIKSKERFSDEGWQEIKKFHARIVENMQIAQTIFLSEDPELAQQLIEEKRNVASAARNSSEMHFDRLSAGLPASIATSSIHLDIIRDYRQINSYITSVAYEILKGKDDGMEE